ncbi:alpha/beta hydrolase [Chryseobacterium phosphatilyticum]|uniref:Alpha/beta hydrolase n=1 Tax=Chryseobacterium phosphatilyticum TaxID=475075 RepID=A0A316XEX6_9FLAO|nr:alpha/beta hydrolase [Chryseobacterium phosphatilyticum]PWN71276.1 alpha/beta hydrolase [Chryseobacterium phosphatilyticum]
MKSKIDAELWKAITKSPFNTIDYENLLVHNPAQIRNEEMKISLQDQPIPIPEILSVQYIYIPSIDSSRNIRLRIYRPKGKQNLPVFLYFHGGAFIYGTPEQYDFFFFRLAIDTEMLIVSVDYRLAPEHPFPAAMEDGYDTLLWLSENASLIDGNNRHLLIGGSSAGATIAASITHLSRDRKEVKIKHQYLMYPPMSDLLETPSMKELANAPMQTKKAAEWMWKHYLDIHKTQSLPYAVPLLENNFRNLPEATIIVCELDPLKDEGKAYADKLQQAGISVNFIEIKGAVHAFDFFPCLLSETFYTKQTELFKNILTQAI